MTVICPLRVLRPTGRDDECLEKVCAWWDPEAKRCGVVSGGAVRLISVPPEPEPPWQGDPE